MPCSESLTQPHVTSRRLAWRTWLFHALSLHLGGRASLWCGVSLKSSASNLYNTWGWSGLDCRLNKCKRPFSTSRFGGNLRVSSQWLTFIARPLADQGQRPYHGSKRTAVFRLPYDAPQSGSCPLQCREGYHAPIGRSVTDFAMVRLLLLLRVRAAEIDVVDGARSRHRSAIGWLRRNAPH
jgi:hypothetical protein